MKMPAPATDHDALLREFDRTHATLRRGLIRFLLKEKAIDAEDLADEAISRVVSAIQKGASIENLTNYAYGVAKYVHREAGRDVLHRAGELTDLVPLPEHDEFAEIRSECLKVCLAKLPKAERRVIETFYGITKRRKGSSHEELAKELRLTPGALRIKVMRIRNKLGACVKACVEQQKP